MSIIAVGLILSRAVWIGMKDAGPHRPVARYDLQAMAKFYTPVYMEFTHPDRSPQYTSPVVVRDNFRKALATQLRAQGITLDEADFKILLRLVEKEGGGARPAAKGNEREKPPAPL